MQGQITSGLFGGDGATVAISDAGNGAAGKLSVGDVITVTQSDGTSTNRLATEGDVYNVEFRTNMVKASELASDPAWKFTEDIVDLPKARLEPAETRGNDKIIGRTDYWELVQTRGEDNKPFQYLKIRETDDNGNPVNPADAVNHMFTNKDEYLLDCATPIRLLNLKAQLDTVGADDFNRSHQGLSLHSHFEAHDTNGDNLDSGFQVSFQTATENNADGSIPHVEYSRFNPSNDTLVPGEWRYFDKAGDISSSNQGTNRIYIGPGENGQEIFWEIGGGMTSIDLKNPPLGEHLTSLRGDAPVDRLAAIDLNNPLA
ncbi:MAG: hypothetical protein WC314_01865 [Vulcanimicrobiota bacterium]